MITVVSLKKGMASIEYVVCGGNGQTFTPQAVITPNGDLAKGYYTQFPGSKKPFRLPTSMLNQAKVDMAEAIKDYCHVETMPHLKPHSFAYGGSWQVEDSETGKLYLSGKNIGKPKPTYGTSLTQNYLAPLVGDTSSVILMKHESIGSLNPPTPAELLAAADNTVALGLDIIWHSPSQKWKPAKSAGVYSVKSYAEEIAEETGGKVVGPNAKGLYTVLVAIP